LERGHAAYPSSLDPPSITTGDVSVIELAVMLLPSKVAKL